MNTHIEIVITQSSIDNGRLYIESRHTKFFPSDSFGDRSGGDGKGNTISIETDIDKKETDIRHLSTIRFGPRASFGAYLKRLNVKAGDVLSLRRVSDRQYKLELGKYEQHNHTQRLSDEPCMGIQFRSSWLFSKRP